MQCGDWELLVWQQLWDAKRQVLPGSLVLISTLISLKSVHISFVYHFIKLLLLLCLKPIIFYKPCLSALHLFLSLFSVPIFFLSCTFLFFPLLSFPLLLFLYFNFPTFLSFTFFASCFLLFPIFIFNIVRLYRFDILCYQQHMRLIYS